MELPLAPVDRILRKAGARRVSESAVKALAQFIEDEGMRIAKRANELARHTGRKTVTEEDIRAALRT